ncbi:MAG TPA: hypothetical protein ACQGQI_00300 [Xylella sp.]
MSQGSSRRFSFDHGTSLKTPYCVSRLAFSISRMARCRTHPYCWNWYQRRLSGSHPDSGSDATLETRTVARRPFYR